MGAIMPNHGRATRHVGVTGQPLRYNTSDNLLNPHFIAYGDASRNWLQYVPRS